MIKMKKYLAGCFILALAITLVGCGEKNTAKFEKTPYDIYKSIESDDMPYSRWYISKESQKSYNELTNPEIPLFTIYVKPYAEDGDIEDCINMALLIDKAMGEDKDYRKYIKKNKKLYINFMIYDTEIARMDLTGKHSYDSIEGIVRQGLEAEDGKVRASLDEFHRFLDEYENIEKDDEGGYYFILDSSNVTESIAKIAQYVDEIEAHNPVNEEFGNVYIVHEDKAYYDGYYVIYRDQYGKDALTDVISGEKVYKFGFWMGSGTPTHIAYLNYITRGKVTDDSESYELDILPQIDDSDNSFDISLSYSSTEANTTEEDIIPIFYEQYYEVCNMCSEHGLTNRITWSFDADIHIPNDVCMMHFRDALTNDRTYSYEEFEKKLLSVEETEYESENALYDDCF